MTTVNDLDKRVSVLETEVENMEKTIMKMDSIVHENFEGTLAIKERLDKWNGSIPHLAEDVKEMRGMQIQLLAAINKKSVIDAKQSTKLNIMWAIGAALVGGAVTLVIKLLVA